MRHVTFHEPNQYGIVAAANSTTAPRPTVTKVVISSTLHRYLQLGWGEVAHSTTQISALLFKARTLSCWIGLLPTSAAYAHFISRLRRVSPVWDPEFFSNCLSQRRRIACSASAGDFVARSQRGNQSRWRGSKKQAKQTDDYPAVLVHLV